MKLELIAVIIVTMVTVDCRSLNRKPRESKDYSGDYTNEGLIPVVNGPQDGVEVVEIDSVPEGQQHDVMTIDVDVDDNGKVSQRFRQAGDNPTAGVPTAGEVTVLDPNQGSTDSPGMSSSDTGSSEDPPSESPPTDGPGDSSSEGPDFSLPDPPSRPPGPMSTAVPVTP
ncbi:hypothetical protein HDE_11519 [Halotydeus destructor]|nr:hypothetical protein HDE_11519 [Halotydeus destructor]